MRRAVLAFAVAASNAAAGSVREAVDWQAGVVRCTGSGAANLQAAAGNAAVARIGAERAAKLDALRNCLEAVKGVQVTSDRTVGTAMAQDSALQGKVEGVVRGFRVVGKPRYFSDGGVEMDVEVPLQGALSDLVLPRATQSPAQGTAPEGTGLLVDARGLEVSPALAPRILDEQGNELYGPGMLSEAARKAGGGAGYAKDPEVARKELGKRLGDRPVTVKAVRARGADLFLSGADAASLAGKAPGFLAEGRVVIVTD
jgi:hypothetical protein